MPSIVRAFAASASARSGWRSKTARSTPGSTRPRTGRWLRPWTPAPISAARGGRPSTFGANLAIATPDTAAVRSAVIGPASRMASGTPVVESARRTRPWSAGRSRPLLAGNPAIHFIPSRSSPPSGEAPRRYAGIACANDPSGRGWSATFGGSSASSTSAIIVRSARRSRSSRGGIASATSAALR